MTTINLAEHAFARTIQDNDIVLVVFWASWCRPCRMFAPTYEAAAAQHPEVVFAKVDTEAEPALAAAAAIRSVPTLMAFRAGVLVFSYSGALTAPKIDQVITDVKCLNAEQIHTQPALDQAEQT